MKIAVSAVGTELSSTVAPFAGQDAGFIIYDADHFSFAVLDDTTGCTQFPLKGDGWVEMITDAGVDVLVVGGIALELAHKLRCSGIRTYECISATVWEAIQALKLNLLHPMDTGSDTISNWNATED